MEVILKEYVPNVGKMGQVVDVKEGFGRNYLFPRGLAVPATKHHKSALAHEKAMLEKKAAKMTAEARGIAEKLAGVRLTLFKATGETGKLYGSVTAMDIEDALHDKGLTAVSRRQIQLDHPIKELGDYEVPIRVHADVVVNVKLTVSPRAEG